MNIRQLTSTLTAVIALSVTWTAGRAEAKSLNCFSQDYTATTITVNRDGYIGFNGTFMTLNTQSGFLGSGIDRIALKTLTGRDQDKSLTIKSFDLPMGPKSACTQNNDTLDADF